MVPIGIYTVTKLDLSCLKNEHTWGYSALVLEHRLQNGKIYPSDNQRKGKDNIILE